MLVLSSERQPRCAQRRHCGRGPSRPRRCRSANSCSLARAHVARVKTWAPPARSAPLEQRRGTSCCTGTADVEVWLIHWPTDGGLVLHDHGGSGRRLPCRGRCAFDQKTRPWGGRVVRQQRLRRNEGKSLGPSHVHSVVNSERAAATSVHALFAPAHLDGLSTSRRPAALSSTEWRPIGGCTVTDELAARSPTVNAGRRSTGRP